VNSVHKKLTRYSCDLCDFSSYYRSDLETHSKAVHLGKKEFMCDICDKAFSRNGVLTKHVNRIHKELKNYSCELCNFTTYTKCELEKHSILKHAHQNDGLVKTNILIKEAQKDQMFVSVENYLPETYSDHKYFEETVEMDIKEEDILETMEIEIKEEFVADPFD
jgi:NAD-dependent SIR2 family protein deacetylase